MPLEVFGFITDLVPTNPLGTDPKSQGDDHLRGLKETLQSQFTGFTGEAVTVTESDLNSVVGLPDDIAALALRVSAMENSSYLSFATSLGVSAVFAPGTGIPQESTSGTEILFTSITPVRVGNVLEIESTLYVSNVLTGSQNNIGIWERGVADAKGAGWDARQGSGGAASAMHIRVRVPVLDLTPRDYSVRAGVYSGGDTMYINSFNNVQQFGGVLNSYISVREYEL
jgi:hypothetical protein